MKKHAVNTKLAFLTLTITLLTACSTTKRVSQFDATVPNPSPLSVQELITAVSETEGRVIIRYRNPPGKNDEDKIKQAGGKVRAKFRSLAGLSAKIPEGKLTALLKEKNIAFIEPDYRLYANILPNDPSFSNQWGLHNTGQTGGSEDADIDAPEAWDLSTGDASTVIALIDTGADISHSDLADNIWTNPGEVPNDGIDNDGNGYIDDITGWDFFHNDNTLFDPSDGDDHGTHVAGIMAAKGHNATGVAGLNWSGKIMVIKFLGPKGGFTSDAIKAIEYASEKGAKIINASWGGGGFSQSLKDAIALYNNLFVAAAGNNAINTDSSPHYPSNYTLANIISVAASNDQDNLASFSNWGATSVDLAAPGQTILSTTPGNSYSYFSGTSMAAPFVSGVCGLLYSLYPNSSALQIKAMVLDYTDPLASLNGKVLTGGRLNAHNALSGILPPQPPPPPPPPPHNRNSSR